MELSNVKIFVSLLNILPIIEFTFVDIAQAENSSKMETQLIIAQNTRSTAINIDM